MKSKKSLLQHVSLITIVGSSNIHHNSKIAVYDQRSPNILLFITFFVTHKKNQMALFATRKSYHEKSKPFEKMLFELQLLSTI